MFSELKRRSQLREAKKEKEKSKKKKSTNTTTHATSSSASRKRRNNTTVAETPADAEVDVRSKVAELRELIAHQQAQQQAAMDEIEGLLASDGV